MIQRSKELSDFITDIQYIADQHNFTYSAKTLKEVNQLRYHLITPKMKKNVRETDYVMCELNYLLEVMVKFYGKREFKGR